MLTGTGYPVQGRPEMALEHFEKESDPAFRLAGLALVQHTLGNSEASEVALREFIETYGEERAYQVEQIHVFRKEANEAFGPLKRAYDKRDSRLAEIKIDPLLASLHDDPRWTPSLKKMGLAD